MERGNRETLVTPSSRVKSGVKICALYVAFAKNLCMYMHGSGSWPHLCIVFHGNECVFLREDWSGLFCTN